MFYLEYVGSSYDYVNDERRDTYMIYKNNEPIYVEKTEYFNTSEEVWMYLMIEIDEERREIVFTKRPTFFDNDGIAKVRAYYDNRLHSKIKNNDSFYNYLKETLPSLLGFELTNL